MSLIDDLRTRVELAKDNLVTDIYTFIGQRYVDPMIKVGEPEAGNLSPAEIAAGKRGASGRLAQPSASAAQTGNAAQASQIRQSGFGILPFVVIAGLAYFAFSNRSRRG